ncbi:hypothetical protein HWV62_20754 [Athelia sp. TMB]|nr:hypothetical protein HWV62_20754 [Athelia sp. TMB]
MDASLTTVCDLFLYCRLKTDLFILGANGSLPIELVTLPGAIEQMTAGVQGDAGGYTAVANSIMDTATEYQPLASGARFAQPRVLNSNLKQANKAKAIQLERNSRKEAGTGSLMRRLAGSLWHLPAPDAKGNRKGMIPSQADRFVVLASEMTLAHDILEQLRNQINGAIEKRTGTDKHNLTLDNTTLFAAESKNKYARLEDNVRQGTLGRLVESIGEKTGINYKAGNIPEIRFVFNYEELFPESSDNDSETDFRPQATRKRKAAKQSALSSKKPILRSAFPSRPVAQPALHRNPPLLEYKFVRTTARVDDNCEVIFKTGEGTEVVMVAEDWKDGSKMDDHYDTGYIGEGSTKRGIYCRIGGREMVLTQLVEGGGHTEGQVWAILTAEYKLLCLGHYLKARYDDWVKECKVSSLKIPTFAFNFTDSVLGTIKFEPSQKRVLPFTHFIATPLLPCGKFDSGIVKYTGNDQMGEATDDITKAIHAFTHFTHIYTRRSIVLCDLQGLRDLKGCIQLIDPQAHSATRTPDSVYWDGGLTKMEALMAEHEKECENNWVCVALDLEATEVASDDENTGPSDPSPGQVTPVPSPKKRPLRIGRTPTKRAQD